MRFFKINLMPMDTAFAFTKDEPSGFKDNSYKLSDGEKVIDADGYPPAAAVRMAEGFGRKLGGTIGNTQSLLIVSLPMKQVIERFVADSVQYLPIVINNHKGRVASKDYFIVNPLGQCDCLDLDESEIEYDGDDVVEVETFVLSEPKVAGVSDLFRVKEDPATIVASERIVRDWIHLQPRPPNVYVDELTVAPAKHAAGAKAKKKP
jgi:hypothetical protein